VRLCGGQSDALLTPLCLRDRFPTQRLWKIAMLLPFDETIALATQISERTKMIPLPKALAPQAIEALDHAMAFRLGRRNEDQLDAEIQCQSYKGTDASRCFAATGEGGVIIQLPDSARSNPSLVRHAQGVSAASDSRASLALAVEGSRALLLSTSD
jgi:hypothetical protein